ncbi:phosphoglucomutase [Veillonella sp. R32]|uniref:phosphoglucomutase n=1 Tax=Veillonella sp. R32 TaxID=2021312 RepID=UPI0013898602|nr:phosphoglucomutase [Veillonella sp. R32]KAF1683373.1 alpha-D-glucose phosphate-specific phosphoglucomutase [Veillonella sp. R32]
MVHALAGTLVRSEDLIDLESIIEAYYQIVPQYDNKEQRISFGTSGHRGKSLAGSFNELHVAAIAQAICDGRKEFGATGVCFVGHDTHALSEPAIETVLEVLAANGVVAAVDGENGFVPTPSVSRAIIRYNEIIDKQLALDFVPAFLKDKVGQGKADGIIITPSHNPPDQGGIKYNPINGGPADTTITKWIETKANEYIKSGGEGIRRVAIDEIDSALQWEYDYKGLYVAELADVINFDVIRKAKPKVLVNALGGSGMEYWEAISDTYQLDLTIINNEYDPTFSFMPYDHDGVVRMDCSSAYAMADVVKQIGQFDLAVGNDPDYDRYGIVTKAGLMPPNHFLVAAGAYLFYNRQWSGKGFGKTAVVTGMVDKFCADNEITVYEVPVGFKYFASLLFDGTIGIGGEESAGASFLKKDGTVWTTDKDGMIMALLALEMWSVTGRTPDQLYDALTQRYGTPVFTRIDTPCTKATKEALSQLKASDVTATELAGEPIESIRTTSLYGEYALGGLRITTANSFLVARPSGTEDLYKVYAESFNGEEALESLLKAGKDLVNEVTAR